MPVVSKLDDHPFSSTVLWLGATWDGNPSNSASETSKYEAQDEPSSMLRAQVLWSRRAHKRTVSTLRAEQPVRKVRSHSSSLMFRSSVGIMPSRTSRLSHRVIVIHHRCVSLSSMRLSNRTEKKSQTSAIALAARQTRSSFTRPWSIRQDSKSQ